MNATTTAGEGNSKGALYLSMELSARDWKLGFTVGMAQKVRRRRIGAGDTRALSVEIGRAKQRFGLADEARVFSCYEAGADGFWLHRYLSAQGLHNIVLDSASIQVDRRKRRAKSDGLDVQALVVLLLRYHGGEPKVVRVVRVPPEEIEDVRQLHRELDTLKHERTAMRNRIRGLLATQGVKLASWRRVDLQLERMRRWDGSAFGPQLKARIGREVERLEVLARQIRALESEQCEVLSAPQSSDEPTWVTMTRRLQQLRGIGVSSARVLVVEAFAWREFRNRRQVGGLIGLTPTPFQSGDSNHEQGISKAGNVWMRRRSVQLAWMWLRWQPGSELSREFNRQYGPLSSRQRRVGIVKLARKLMIALWRYTTSGEVPQGASLSRSPAELDQAA